MIHVYAFRSIYQKLVFRSTSFLLHAFRLAEARSAGGSPSLRSVCYAFFFILLPFLALSQPSWTWLKGNATTPNYGLYGSKGVAGSGGKPGSRGNQVMWGDSTGKVWMLGGSGVSVNNTGFLNDLWNYDATSDSWTWVNGDPVANRPGTYNQLGVASTRNNIQGRSSAARWQDAQGNLWVYGGIGYLPVIMQVNAPLNDLWKYSPSSNTWTWMGGDTIWDYRLVNATLSVVYGQRGVEAAGNKPPPKNLAQTWTDHSGNLWMYGGNRIPVAVTGQYTSDLWRYSTTSGQWTWMSGDSLIEQAPRYGTLGLAAAANKPGARITAATWTDRQGNLWMFGGQGQNGKMMADLWMFNPSNSLWTWEGGDTLGNLTGQYGTRGIAAPANRPGARYGMLAWADSSDIVWLYGGNNHNDMWQFNASSGMWTWISGDSTTLTKAITYGIKGIPSDSAYPAAGLYMATWTDTAKNLWLAWYDSFWKYTPATKQWTWVRGDSTASSASISSPFRYPSVYGVKGQPDVANNPPSRTGAATWTDKAGVIWMFGGNQSSGSGLYGSSAFYNDVWKYSPPGNQWTWVKGDSVFNRPANYGTMGIPSDSTTPGARSHAATWIDTAGNFWLFGGTNQLYTSSSMYNFLSALSDLWKYNPVTNQWTWVGGSSTSNTYGQYTMIGNDPRSRHPGARFSATSWTDSSENFWLFGGQGLAEDSRIYYTNTKGKLNDLWKYTPSTGLWILVNGSNLAGVLGMGAVPSLPGTYGTKGVPDPANNPGGRSSASGWTDANNNLWLFGGVADNYPYNNEPVRNLGYKNDLWRFNPQTTQWTWMAGHQVSNSKGVYGSVGTGDANTTPGSRSYTTTWKGPDGNLYLFGGNKDSLMNWDASYNDYWKFSLVTNQWTWLGGDPTYNMPGVYGQLGIPSPQNKPGARNGSQSWTDPNGNLYLFGGYGTPVNGTRDLDDLMRYSFSLALPVQFSRFTAQKQGENVQLNWTTAQEQNSQSFLIERSADGAAFSKIGTVAAAGNSTIATSYTFTDFLPLKGDNFYRLKEVDKDGKSQYSTVQKVHISDGAAVFSILSNPVQHTLRVNLDVQSAQEMQLQVRDAGGHVLMSKKTTAVKGSNALQMSVDQLPPGTYFLQVESKDLHGTKAFVKQ